MSRGLRVRADEATRDVNPQGHSTEGPSDLPVAGLCESTPAGTKLLSEMIII